MSQSFNHFWNTPLIICGPHLCNVFWDIPFSTEVPQYCYQVLSIKFSSRGGNDGVPTSEPVGHDQEVVAIDGEVVGHNHLEWIIRARGRHSHSLTQVIQCLVSSKYLDGFLPRILSHRSSRPYPTHPGGCMYRRVYMVT